MNFQNDLDDLAKLTFATIKEKAHQFDRVGKSYRIEYDIMTKWRSIDKEALDQITEWLRGPNITVIEVNTDNSGVIIVCSMMGHGSTCDEIHRRLKVWLNSNFQVFVGGPRIVWGQQPDDYPAKG